MSVMTPLNSFAKCSHAFSAWPSLAWLCTCWINSGLNFLSDAGNAFALASNRPRMRLSNPSAAEKAKYRLQFKTILEITNFS